MGAAVTDQASDSNATILTFKNVKKDTGSSSNEQGLQNRCKAEIAETKKIHFYPEGTLSQPPETHRVLCQEGGVAGSGPETQNAHGDTL